MSSKKNNEQCDFHAWSKHPKVTQCCYRTSSLQQTTWWNTGVGFNWWLLAHAKFQLEMFPGVMIDDLVPSTLSNQLLVWCCHKSWHGWPMMQHRVPVSNPSFRILQFHFFQISKEKFQMNIKTSIAFVQISRLGIVPSEIHVKSRCSNLSITMPLTDHNRSIQNLHRNMAMTPCSLCF